MCLEDFLLFSLIQLYLMILRFWSSFFCNRGDIVVPVLMVSTVQCQCICEEARSHSSKQMSWQPATVLEKLLCWTYFKKSSTCYYLGNTISIITDVWCQQIYVGMLWTIKCNAMTEHNYILDSKKVLLQLGLFASNQSMIKGRFTRSHLQVTIQ